MTQTIDLVELNDELWIASVRKHLEEMWWREDGTERYSRRSSLPGPFQSGFQLAIEEIAERLGIEIRMELEE